MLAQRMAFLSSVDVAAIHDASMEALSRVGVAFYHEEALAVFQRHGVCVEGRTVFLDEEDVMAAVASAPASFTIHARDPACDVVIGRGKPHFVPGYGAPFILEENGRRQPTVHDYDNLVRLADALPNQDLSGRLLVQPADLPPCSAHLRMTYGGMVNSAKPFMGSADGIAGARATMEMAQILFEVSAEDLIERPVTIALLDSTSPLQYSAEIAGALLEYARWRQPVLMSSLVMAGATGPITLAGALAQQNAEVLAGITLTQLVSPGAPVVYGSSSTMMDMRSGTLALGSPEYALLATASAQLARHYGLPSRGGGGVTDAHSPDMQAGFESMLGLTTAVASGVDFVLHAAGILSSYLAFSYEKFVLDDELCGMARRLWGGIPVTADTLAVDVIESAGVGGNFLEETHTLEQCRTAFWQPALCRRQGYEQWEGNGRIPLTAQAQTRWQTLLAEHQPLPIDPLIDRQLQGYMTDHGC